ncbi:MAG: hypothetical protein P9M00_09430 [Candidatus Tritonobacter lacicola]|nr:hypothetical protein [Candidatus Tritonobacter lacicola]
MTAFGIVKLAKMVLWVVGGAVAGLIVAWVTGMVKDKEMPILIGAVIGLLVGLFLETFSEE